MRLTIGICFLLGFIANSSTPPELFYKKDSKFISLGSFSNENFCSGTIPQQKGFVSIYCRLVPDIGPDNSEQTPTVHAVYPCIDGQIHGVVKIQGCYGYPGEETYVKGVKEGPAKFFFSNKKIKYEESYLKGKLNGTRIEYAEDGTILSKVDYVMGFADGKSYYFSPYTKVGITRFTKNGQQITEPEYSSIYVQEPLIAAAGNGDLSIVKKLIEKGAQPNAYGETESTTASAVYKAVEGGKEDVLNYLLSNGGDINQFDKFNSRTPLISAVSRPKMVTFLLNHGAKPNLKNHENNTALHEASKYGYLETLELLLLKGADRSVKNNEGKTPLDIAKASTHQQKDKIIALLSGQSNAQEAMEDRKVKECKEKSKALGRYVEVEKNRWEDEFKDCPKGSLGQADLNAALHIAAQNGLVTAAESLVKRGADVNSHDQVYQSTPLMLAAREGKIETTEFFLNQTTDVNHQDSMGKTALMYAIQWAKNKEVVSLLLKHHPKLDLKNKDGYTALDLANQGKLPEITALLKAAAAK